MQRQPLVMTFQRRDHPAETVSRGGDNSPVERVEPATRGSEVAKKNRFEAQPSTTGQSNEQFHPQPDPHVGSTALRAP